MKANLQVLTAYNLADVDVAFATQDRPVLRMLVHALAWWPARQLAQTLVAADAIATTDGMAAAGDFLVARIAGTYACTGAEALPRHGPLLCVANHPGVVDAPALCAAIGRADLRIIAGERALLQALPGIQRHLIAVPESGTGRAQAVRTAARHLRDGGAVLTFPAGRIEPDPAVMDDAVQSLAGWSDMPAVLHRLVPTATVYGMCVSGIYNPAVLRHPLVQRRGARRDQEWLAATLQLLLPWYRVPLTTIHAAPVPVAAPVEPVMQALIAAARRARRLPLQQTESEPRWE